MFLNLQKPRSNANSSHRILTTVKYKMTKKGANSQADIEWEDRTLCSDESCIGVIGPNGRCKECGKPFGTDKAKKAPRAKTQKKASHPTADAVDDQSGIEAEKDFDETAKTGSMADLDWEDRTLCSDESCIGVIDSIGRCKECGKSFSQAG